MPAIVLKAFRAFLTSGSPSSQPLLSEMVQHSIRGITKSTQDRDRALTLRASPSFEVSARICITLPFQVLVHA